MKTNALKLSQEVLGRVEVADLRRPTRRAVLSLMRLQPRVMRISMSKDRLFVTIEDQSSGEIPQPVKITHIG
ncbi:MAG: hypothetical protein ABSE97_07210 [Verrucomicrobiota bacterium]|jgi:hypothetical protein